MMVFHISIYDIKAVDKSSVYLMDSRILLSLHEQDSHIQNQARLFIEAMLKSLTNRYSDLGYNSL